MLKNYKLALTSAFLLWLAWPPMSFTAPVLLVAFVPLFIAIERIFRLEEKKKGRKVFWLTFTTFFLWNTSCIYWVFNSLNAVMPIGAAIPISLIPFGLAAILMTIAFGFYYQLRMATNRFLSYLGLVCFWIAYEYLHQTWDLAFPWMTLGNGFAESHRLIQWYQYTGVYGGTLWILTSNLIAFELYLRMEEQSKKLNAIRLSLAACVLIPITISIYMYNGYAEKNNPANVVVVQPNIDPYRKFGDLPPSEQIKTLIRLSDSVAQNNTEYFIWPETAIPENTDEDYVRESGIFNQVQQFLNRYKNGNVLSGIESYRLYDSAKTPTSRHVEQIGKYADSFNAAIQIENSARVQFYHKSKLVPGVEQLPFASALSFMKPLFAAFGGTTGGYGKQDEPSVFYAQSGIGVSPIICYESIWGEYVGRSVKQGAQLIAIVTNDGWWGNTSGKDQHMAYAKLRAIETRRWIARSANTGISGFINQRGDVVKQSGWWEPTALKADVNLNDELTFYVKHGDYIAMAGSSGAGLFAIFLLISRLRRRRAG